MEYIKLFHMFDHELKGSENKAYKLNDLSSNLLLTCNKTENVQLITHMHMCNVFHVLKHKMFAILNLSLRQFYLYS